MGGNVLDPGEKGARERGKNVEGRSDSEKLRGWRRRNGKDAEREVEGKKRARWYRAHFMAKLSSMLQISDPVS